jgi:hypothetical protein
MFLVSFLVLPVFSWESQLGMAQNFAVSKERALQLIMRN